MVVVFLLTSPLTRGGFLDVVVWVGFRNRIYYLSGFLCSLSGEMLAGSRRAVFKNREISHLSNSIGEVA